MPSWELVQSLEVCKVLAACQWYSCKLFQLCRSICAQNPHLWTAAGLFASLWISSANLLCTTTYLSHWHQDSLREKLDTHHIWSTVSWFKLPLGPPRQIWFCVHLELALYVTSNNHLQIWPAHTTANVCRLVNLLIHIWSKINYQWGRCKKWGTFSIINYINFSCFHSAYCCRVWKLDRLHRINKLLAPCKQIRSQKPNRQESSNIWTEQFKAK